MTVFYKIPYLQFGVLDGSDADVDRLTRPRVETVSAFEMFTGLSWTKTAKKERKVNFCINSSKSIGNIYLPQAVRRRALRS